MSARRYVKRHESRHGGDGARRAGCARKGARSVSFALLLGTLALAALGMHAMARAGAQAPFAVVPAAPSAQNKPLTPAAQDAAPVSFDRLMKEAGIVLSLPEGWKAVTPPSNPWFDFDRAWKSPDGTMEIRLAVRPIARMVLDYEDPHSSAPDPNDMHGLMFTAMIGQFARQGEMPSRDLPRALARKTFNADWAAMAAFGADPALNTQHREGMLLALHKHRTADVFVLFLYDDPERSKPLLKDLLKVVRFKQATPLAVLKREEEEAAKARNAYLEEGMKAGAGPEQCIPPLNAKQVHKMEKDLDQSPKR